MAEYLYRVKDLKTGKFVGKVWKRECDVKAALNHGSLSWLHRWGEDHILNYEVVIVEQKEVKTMPLIAYRLDKKIKIAEV